MHIKRRVWLLIILAIIILAVGYGFMPRPTVVETAEVKLGPMQLTIDEEGQTRVINRYIISAPVSGYALRIDFDVGNRVSKGQVITRMEPLRSHVLDPRSRAEAEARISAAEATLKSAIENVNAAKAGAEFAKKELERIKKLYKEELAAQEQLDEAETNFIRTEAARRSSEFAVNTARYEKEALLTSLKYSAAEEREKYPEEVLIKAPVSGRILKINHESEGVVQEGHPLIEIGDPRALEVEVDVLSADAVRIRPGMSVFFERWGGEVPLRGKVRVIEPAGFTKISALGVEEQRVLVISDIVSSPEEWEHLGDGYRVEASFILRKEDNLLKIPESALFRFKDSWAVFAIKNKKAQLRKVKVGLKNGMEAQIMSGLGKGDKVIIHPDRSIEDGSRIKLRR